MRLHLSFSNSEGNDKQPALDCSLSTWNDAGCYFYQAPRMLAWRFTQEANPCWQSHGNPTAQRTPVLFTTLFSSQELQAFGCGERKNLGSGQTSVGQTGRTYTKQKVNLCLPTSVQVQPRGAIKKAALICRHSPRQASEPAEPTQPGSHLQHWVKFTYSITPPRERDLTEVKSHVRLVQPVHN